MEMSEEQKRLVKLYMGNLMGLKQIGFQTNQDPRTFKKKITSLGIEIPYPGSIWTKMKKHIEGAYLNSIPYWLIEVISGIMLGDGSMRLQSKTFFHPNHPTLEHYKVTINLLNEIQEKVKEGLSLTKTDVREWNKGIQTIRYINTANLRMHKSILELEWVKVLAKIFNEYFQIQPFVKKNLTKSTKWSCGFDTSSSVQLFKIWKQWYRVEGDKQSKILPNIVKITPNVLLHWYVGDGYYCNTDISLCSHNFTWKEQDMLVCLLKEQNIKATIREKSGVYYVGISTKESNKEIFFEYIRRAKFYKQAKKLFPHKFSAKITKRKIVKKMKIEHPEYFKNSPEIRKKILIKLSEM